MTLVNQSFGDFLGVTITGAVALVSGVILLFDYRNLLSSPTSAATIPDPPATT